MKLAAIAAGLLALLAVSGLQAQSNRSLTDSEKGILLAQNEAAGTATQNPVVATSRDDGETPNDVEGLQEKVLLLRSTIKGLTDSLAIANSEAEMFKRQSADQALKLEALGVASVEKDQGKLEQRLLSAVSDLRLLKKQNEEAVNELVRLTDAIQVLLKSTDQIAPEIRLSVETELRKTNEILGTPTAPTAGAVAATLSDGMIVDLKDDLSLVIANLGEKQGVRIGMPFQVWRDDKRIGEVRVIDVRDRISGAIIQNLESEKVQLKVGDRLKVDARQ